MKAISLRQPWATLVVQGKKTLELRNWTVSYRGLLAIHASQTVNEIACRALGIPLDQITTGALVGVVELVDIQPLDKAIFTRRANEHLAQGFYSPPGEQDALYGWELRNARELLHPITFHGRMGLFNVPDELVAESAETEGSEDRSYISVEPLTTENWDVRQPFELRVIPESQKAGAPNPSISYRLALYQRIVEPPPAQGRLSRTAPVEMRLVAELSGSLLKVIADQILDALRQNGYSATDLSPSRRVPFLLSEESGVRLGLLFMAVKPISKMNRVEAISMGIRAMTSEELYYWFSKCASLGNAVQSGARSSTAERAQKALRLMLSDE